MKPQIGDAFKSLDIRGQVQKKKCSREQAIVSAIVATMSEIVLFTGKCSNTDLAKFFKFADKELDWLCENYRYDGLWKFDGNPLRYIFCQEMLRQNGTKGIETVKRLCKNVGWNYRKSTAPEEFERTDGYAMSFMVHYQYEDEADPYEYPCLYHLDTKIKVGDRYRSGKSEFVVKGFDVASSKYRLDMIGKKGEWLRTEEDLKKWQRI
jgi:hypothetical protein